MDSAQKRGELIRHLEQALELAKARGRLFTPTE